MKAKSIVPREAAVADVELATDYNLAEAGTDVASAFIEALEAAYAFIGEAPRAGSPRWANELSLPDLRATPIMRFPWLVFYVEHADHIDVWRVLHAQRDVPSWITAKTSG